jgi:hypothetical protein
VCGFRDSDCVMFYCSRHVLIPSLRASLQINRSFSFPIVCVLAFAFLRVRIVSEPPSYRPHAFRCPATAKSHQLPFIIPPIVIVFIDDILSIGVEYVQEHLIRELNDRRAFLVLTGAYTVENMCCCSHIELF